MKPTYEELEQQLAESHRALRAETTAHDHVKMHLEKMAAENAGLKSFGDKLNEMHNDLNGEGTGIQGRAEVACQQVALEAAMEEFDAIKTPATDAFLAEVRAQGVDEFLRGSQLPYQIATVLADYDNVDDATLQTVIWSGQPPEPDGDVWHLEYVSRGNAIVRAVLKELRKGVQQ